MWPGAAVSRQQLQRGEQRVHGAARLLLCPPCWPSCRECFEVISLLCMLSMILFQHFLHVLPGAESSLGHMEKRWSVILLQTTCSIVAGVRRALSPTFGCPLSPLPEADCSQILVFLTFHGPAELWSATPASCWPATQKSCSGASLGGSNTTTWQAAALQCEALGPGLSQQRNIL